MKRRKIMASGSAVMLAMALLLAGCGDKNRDNASDTETAVTTTDAAVMETTETTETAETTESAKTGTVGLANPFVTCNTLADAAKTAGFEMTLPENGDMPEGYEETVIQAIEGQLIQVIWQDGEGAEGAGNKIMIRKGTGSEDISGDYNQYPNTEEVAVGDVQVIMKGSDDKVNTAIWTAGDYTYAVSAVKEGVAKDIMSSWIAAIR